MLGWAIVFPVFALIVALFGFAGLASAVAVIARLLVFVFIALFVVGMMLSLMRGRSTS